MLTPWSKPIAQKMMADVLAFINCATSRILINDLRGFYDQFNEGLTYRAYNMRDLTEDDYDLIITSEPGTAKIKSYRIVKQIGKVRGVEATKMTKVQKIAPVIVPLTSVSIQALIETLRSQELMPNSTRILNQSDFCKKAWEKTWFKTWTETWLKPWSKACKKAWKKTWKET